MTQPELIVLGASGTFPQPDRACTGYLLRMGDERIWIDCGSGTFANLQRHIDPHEISAIVISHLHIDHILELFSLYYALAYGRGSKGPQGLPVYAPAGSEAHLEQLVSLTSPEGFGGFFNFKTIRSSDKIAIEPFIFNFQRSLHPIETLSMRIEAGGRVLVNTSDTGWTDDLIEFCEGADLLIAEASMQEPNPAMRQIHMTAEEAGDLAQRARARKLMLTHIVPGLDPNISIVQAQGRFNGEVVLALDNLVVEI